MGSIVKQTVYGEAAAAKEASAQAQTQISQLERQISWKIDSSAVAQINAAAGAGAVTVGGQTLQVLLDAFDVATQSGGAYNPVILPLSLLWQFDSENFSLPTPESVEQALPLLDYTQVELDELSSSVRLKLPGMALDLGGIGKGAACDAALEVYREDAAVTGAIVTAGGSVGLYQRNSQASDYRIGIRDPNGGQNEMMGYLRLRNGCISTSGVYEKQKVVGGVRYHHILDSSTGYPADSDLLSATVVHESGSVSDALATACIVLGEEKAFGLLEQYGAEAVLINSKNQVIVTSGLKDQFHLLVDGYEPFD